MRNNLDIMDSEMPCPEASASETDEAITFLMALRERFQQMYNLYAADTAHINEVGHSTRFDEADDAVRVVAIKKEEEAEAAPALERKMACMKAVENIHEQETLHQEMRTFMQYMRSRFDKIVLQVWGRTSCEDLERPELVEQCNLVLRSSDVVQKFLHDGKTDDEVCDIMSAVTDLNRVDNLSCRLCNRLVEMVNHAVAQDMQQVQHVEGIIGDLCKAMPTDSMCQTFSQDYSVVVGWVKYSMPSHVICSRLTMCSAHSGISSP